MERLNISQIVRINAIKQELDSDYEYRPRTKFLGITISKEGFYDINTMSLSAEYTTEAAILKGGRRFISDNKVYYYPHLEIYMSNQNRHLKWFKTAEEMDDYINSEDLKINKWLNL